MGWGSRSSLRRARREVMNWEMKGMPPEYEGTEKKREEKIKRASGNEEGRPRNGTWTGGHRLKEADGGGPSAKVVLGNQREMGGGGVHKRVLRRACYMPRQRGKRGTNG